jgi:hypothetical protein
MLEILFLVNLTKRIGTIVESKGHKSGGYKLLLVLLWFGGEFFGGIVGALLTGGDESLNCLLYAVALIGAGIGAGISFAIANSLTPIGPSLIPEAGQPIFAPSSSAAAFPALALGILWLLTNAIANVGWGLTYGLVNPNFEESLFLTASLVSGAAAGLIAGILQFPLLMLALPGRNRLILATWVPLSMAGWVIALAAFNLFRITSDALYFLIYLASGLEIGVLQWLVLQRHSRIAYWWIPASMMDWILNWAVFQSSLWYAFNNEVAYNFISGLISWIPTSIAIAILLGGAFLRAGED